MKVTPCHRTEISRRSANAWSGSAWCAAAALSAAAMLLPGAASAAVVDASSAGTLLWGFDGTSIDTDGGGVTELNNQAGTSAGDAVRSNLGTDGGGQAQVVSADTGNGLHDVVAFDGADDTYLSDFGTSISGTQQIFLVVRFDEDGPESVNNYAIDGEDNAGRRPFGVRGTNDPSTYFTGDGGDFITNIEIGFGEWQVVMLSLGGTFNTIEVTDGTPAGTFDQNQGDANTHDMTGLTIGGRTVSPSAQTRFEGQIAEILVYESNLSQVDRTAVTDYLLGKYIVPEPGSLALIGLGSLLLIQRRKA